MGKKAKQAILFFYVKHNRQYLAEYGVVEGIFHLLNVYLTLPGGH